MYIHEVEPIFAEGWSFSEPIAFRSCRGIHVAAFSGITGIVRSLLAKKPANAQGPRGETPLMCAASQGHEAVIHLLLEQGNIDINMADKVGKTPLSYAADGGRDAVVRLLLEEANIDINMADDVGNTPLSYAAQGGHEAVVLRLLLDQDNIDINMARGLNRTPVLGAAQGGHDAVVRLLLEQPNIMADDLSQTPLSYCEDSRVRVYSGL